MAASEGKSTLATESDTGSYHARTRVSLRAIRNSDLLEKSERNLIHPKTQLVEVDYRSPFSTSHVMRPAQSM